MRVVAETFCNPAPGGQNGSVWAGIARRVGHPWRPFSDGAGTKQRMHGLLYSECYGYQTYLGLWVSSIWQFNKVSVRTCGFF